MMLSWLCKMNSSRQRRAVSVLQMYMSKHVFCVAAFVCIGSVPLLREDAMAPKPSASAAEWTRSNARRVQQFRDVMQEESGYPVPASEPAAGAGKGKIGAWATMDTSGVTPLRSAPSDPWEEQYALTFTHAIAATFMPARRVTYIRGRPVLDLVLVVVFWTSKNMHNVF